MRIPSGSTDRYIYFVAVDSTDYATRETGLTTFTVYRSRNGGAAAAMTTPTINEVDATNLPGVYELLLDEDTTLAAGNDTEEMVFHITQASMAPVTRVIELYRPKATEGNTLGVAADSDISGNIAGEIAGIATDALTQIYDAVMTTQMTESYATQGTAPTAAQVMMWVYQRSADAAVSGKTLTVKQLDQTTAAGTVMLDDADNPTTLTRAT